MRTAWLFWGEIRLWVWIIDRNIEIPIRKGYVHLGKWKKQWWWDRDLQTSESLSPLVLWADLFMEHNPWLLILVLNFTTRGWILIDTGNYLDIRTSRRRVIRTTGCVVFTQFLYSVPCILIAWGDEDCPFFSHLFDKKILDSPSTFIRLVIDSPLLLAYHKAVIVLRNRLLLTYLSRCYHKQCYFIPNFSLLLLSSVWRCHYPYQEGYF